MAMKSTGIVRRIDDLGRVVIPKAIRTELGIKEGEPLEIFYDKASRTVQFVKYTPFVDVPIEQIDTIAKTLKKQNITVVGIYDSSNHRVWGTTPRDVEDKNDPMLARYEVIDIAEFGFMVIEEALDDHERAMVEGLCNMLATIMESV